MRNDLYLKSGKLFFGIAILAIGIIHIITGNFPAGLLPVAISLPGRILLVYVTGIAMIVAGVLILIKRFTYSGAFLAGVVFLVILLLLHLPKLVLNLYDPGEWAAAFEVFSLFSGALILMGSVLSGVSLTKDKEGKGYKLLRTGSCIFAVALFVFAAQHYLYAQFIAGLIPSWIPAGLFWAYVVMFAFFAASVSIIIQKQVRLSATLLSLLFFLWFWILHMPRVIAKVKIETEWTSLFVVLAMSGIALLIGGSVRYKDSKEYW
jgi:uncharacterized membrane protein